MKKLNLEDLYVDSFSTTPYAFPSGTVNAHQLSPDPTGPNDSRCTYYESCDICSPQGTYLPNFATCGPGTCGHEGPVNTCQQTANDVFTCALNGCGSGGGTIYPQQTCGVPCVTQQCEPI
jgi:hypothetical protein